MQQVPVLSLNSFRLHCSSKRPAIRSHADLLLLPTYVQRPAAAFTSPDSFVFVSEGCTAHDNCYDNKPETTLHLLLVSRLCKVHIGVAHCNNHTYLSAQLTKTTSCDVVGWMRCRPPAAQQARLPNRGVREACAGMIINQGNCKGRDLACQ